LSASAALRWGVFVWVVAWFVLVVPGHSGGRGHNPVAQASPAGASSSAAETAAKYRAWVFNTAQYCGSNSAGRDDDRTDPTDSESPPPHREPTHKSSCPICLALGDQTPEAPHRPELVAPLAAISTQPEERAQVCYSSVVTPRRTRGPPINPSA